MVCLLSSHQLLHCVRTREAAAHPRWHFGWYELTMYEERKERSGWFGYRRGDGETLDEAYGRVTNPQRFLPLHTVMLEMTSQLVNDFEVEITEGYGLDEDLVKGLSLARPDAKLNPADPDAAPLLVAFSDFPGFHVRFGRWYVEPFPGCGCYESPEGEIERPGEMVDDVTAGRFREAIEIPHHSFRASGWVETRFWSPDAGRASTRSRRTSRVDESRAREMTGGRHQLELNWKPWPRRHPQNRSH